MKIVPGWALRTGRGAFHLLSPPVVSAKGIPRKTSLPELSVNPWTLPWSRLTAGEFAAVVAANRMMRGPVTFMMGTLDRAD